MWRATLGVLIGCQVGLMVWASPFRGGRAEDRMVGEDEHGQFPARPGAAFPAWPSSDSHWADVPSHMGASDHWGQWGAAAPLVQVAARDAAAVPQPQQQQPQAEAYGQDFSFGDGEDHNDDFSEPAKRHVDNNKFPGGNDFKSAAQAFSRPPAFEQEPGTFEQPEEQKIPFPNGYAGANEQIPPEQEEGQEQFGGQPFDFGQYQPDQDYEQQPVTYALPPSNQDHQQQEQQQQQQRAPQEHYRRPQSQQENRPPQDAQYGQYDIPEPDFKAGDPEDGEGANAGGQSAFDAGFNQGFPVNVQFDSNSPGHNSGNEYAAPEPARARAPGHRPPAPTPAPSQYEKYEAAKRPERETVSYNTAVTHGPTGSSQSYANFGFYGDSASPSAQAKSPPPPPPLYTSGEDDSGFEPAQSGFPKPKFADFGTPFPTFDDRQQSDVGQPERPQYSRPELPPHKSEREPEPKQEKRQAPKAGDYKYSRINYREPIDRLMKKSEGEKAVGEESSNRDYSSSYGDVSAYSGSVDAKREQPKRRNDHIDPRNKKSEIASVQKDEGHHDDEASSGYYAPRNKNAQEEDSDEEVVAESASNTEIRKEDPATAKTTSPDKARKARTTQG